MDQTQTVAQHCKRLYMVRHGETILNQENRSQPPDTELSARGCSQANALAQRFVNIDFDRIVTSDLTRAEATAKSIALMTSREMVHMPLLREVKRPSEIVGKRWNDTSVLDVRKAMRAHEYDHRWHYSDEENIFDLYARAREAVRFLTERSESNLVVVSHAVFIRMFFCALVTNDEASGLAMYGMIRFSMHLDNAAICIFEHSETDGDTRWRVRAWNDCGHLF